MGLWCAYEALKTGLTVTVIDRDSPGAGASGGVLGALMPHMPSRWNAKKQFQLEALMALEEAAHALEEETGLSTGYRRCGRIVPLTASHLREHAEIRAEGALDFWPERFSFAVMDTSPYTGWPGAGRAPHGVSLDTFSARVMPRALLETLVAAIEKRGGTIISGETVTAIGGDGLVTTSSGQSHSAGAVVIAAGVESFDLMEQTPRAVPGSAIKGQAALFAANAPADLPILYDDRFYLVAHDNGDVAVGATSETAYGDPFTTDDQLEALIGKARAATPLLADAPVIERWAGLRPRSVMREPLVGPLGGRLYALTSGFKISFGIAQLAAHALVASLGNPGKILAVPEGFLPDRHLSLIKDRQDKVS